MIIPHNDPRLSWHGAVSLERTENYTRPWRIPFEQRAFFHPAIHARASMQSGVRLSFHTDSRFFAAKLLPYTEPLAYGQPRRVDLLVNGCSVESLVIPQGETGFRFDGLANEEKRVELWLPQHSDFALESIEIEEGATFAPYEDHRPKWVTYGSSITQCGSAHSPARTWPAIVARERGWNLTCLGYGGQCHLDPQVSLLVRDLPADYISVCAGINIYSQPTLNNRTFPPALLGLVQIIREKKPETPILLISPIYSEPFENTPNPHGWTLENYREAVEEVVQTLQDAGDCNVHYLNGLTLFGKSLKHHLPDQLHPDGDGYEKMARNFLLNAAPMLTGERGER